MSANLVVVRDPFHPALHREQYAGVPARTFRPCVQKYRPDEALLQAAIDEALRGESEEVPQ